MGVIILLIIFWLIFSIAKNLAREAPDESSNRTYGEASPRDSTWKNPRSNDRLYADRDYFRRDDYLQSKMQQSRSGNYNHKASSPPLPTRDKSRTVKESVVLPPDYDGNSVSSLEALLTGDDADVVDGYREEIELMDDGIDPSDIPEFTGEQLAS